MDNRGVPGVVVRRLAIYLRCLREAGVGDDERFISSVQLGQLAGVTAAQVRKDLATFGQFGKQGKGYEGAGLKRQLQSLLKVDRLVNLAVIGVGELGSALTRYLCRYPQDSPYPFRVVAIFDIATDKLGEEVAGLRIEHPRSMAEVVQKHQVRIGVLTVPASAAQAVAEQALASGITAFLNFAPVRLELPPSASVVQADAILELHQLAFLVM